VVGGNVVNRNGFVVARLGAQLSEPTVRFPHKRFFGGPLALPSPQVAGATTIARQRLALQTGQVARELSLTKVVAGPGTIR
jgi:hypothetical protein